MKVIVPGTASRARAAGPVDGRSSLGLGGTVRTDLDRRWARLELGVQHVDLDVLREDAKRDLDGSRRPGRVEQGAEHRLSDLPVALFGQRRLGQAAADEIPDVGNR